MLLIEFVTGDEKHAASSQMRHWARTRKKLRENHRAVRRMPADEAERLEKSTIYETSPEEVERRFAQLKINFGEIYGG